MIEKQGIKEYFGSEFVFVDKSIYLTDLHGLVTLRSSMRGTWQDAMHALIRS